MSACLSNYAAMARRINKADTSEELDKVDRSLCRIYSAGIFTEKQFARLDIKIVEKRIKLEEYE
jgi:hypothetical protein